MLQINNNNDSYLYKKISDINNYSIVFDGWIKLINNKRYINKLNIYLDECGNLYDSEILNKTFIGVSINISTIRKETIVNIISKIRNGTDTENDLLKLKKYFFDLVKKKLLKSISKYYMGSYDDSHTVLFKDLVDFDFLETIRQTSILTKISIDKQTSNRLLELVDGDLIDYDKEHIYLKVFEFMDNNDINDILLKEVDYKLSKNKFIDVYDFEYIDNLLYKSKALLNKELLFKLVNGLCKDIEYYSKTSIIKIFRLLNRSLEKINIDNFIRSKNSSLKYILEINIAKDLYINNIGFSEVIISESLFESFDYINTNEIKDLFKINFNVLFNNNCDVFIENNKRDSFINIISGIINFYDIKDCDTKLMNKIKEVDSTKFIRVDISDEY